MACTVSNWRPHQHIHSERLYPFILSPFVHKWVLLIKNNQHMGKMGIPLFVSFAFLWLQLILKFWHGNWMWIFFSWIFCIWLAQLALSVSLIFVKVLLYTRNSFSCLLFDFVGCFGEILYFKKLLKMFPYEFFP